jgi:hypothetical protein
MEPVSSYQFGIDGDVPTQADFDGDGRTDTAVFRPSTGVWYILRSSNNSFVITQWGVNGDVPVVGDYDGDGLDDIAVFRPSNGNVVQGEQFERSKRLYAVWFDWGLGGYRSTTCLKIFQDVLDGACESDHIHSCRAVLF